MDSISKYFKDNIAIDYANYQRFCVENSLRVLAYSDFLAEVTPNTVTQTVGTAPTTNCRSCGGGKVR